MLKGIKSIVFDIGGVLVDLDFDGCIAAFEAIGFKGAEQLVSCYHPTAIFGALERGEITRAELCDEIRKMAGREFTNDEICEAYCKLITGIPTKKLQMLARLKERGYKLYALSNINEIMMPKIMRFFEADGSTALDYFDDMFLSFQMGVMKPDARIYEMVLDQTECAAHEILFIDDGEKNIEAARELGMMVYFASAHEDFGHLFE